MHEAVPPPPIAKLLNGPAEERAQAYAAVEQLISNGDPVALAPLIPAISLSVLCAHATEVGAEEFRHAALLQAAMISVDPFTLLAEYYRGGAGVKVEQCKTNVLYAVAVKHADQLTEDDALIYGASQAAWQNGTSFGFSQCLAAAQKWPDPEDRKWCDEGFWFQQKVAFHPFHANCQQLPGDHTDETARLRTLRLVSLAFDLADRAEERELCYWDQAGLWLASLFLTIGAPQIGTELFQSHRALERIAYHLRRWTPAERINLRHKESVLAGAIVALVKDVCESASMGGFQDEVLAQLVQYGLIDIIIANLQEYERMPREDPGNVECIWWGSFYLLSVLDLESPKLRVIKEQLRRIPETVRFAIENPLDQFRDFGWTTRIQGVPVAAILWGRDEAAAFEFSEDVLAEFLAIEMEISRPQKWGNWFGLNVLHGRAMLSLVVADHNKSMLLGFSDFLPHLVDGLLLEPSHPRAPDTPGTGTSPEIKAEVQQTFCECLQQLSLYEPARQQMLQLDSSLVGAALRQVANEGLKPEARRCAEGALMALEDQRKSSSSSSSSSVEGKAQWIMMRLEGTRTAYPPPAPPPRSVVSRRLPA